MGRSDYRFSDINECTLRTDSCDPNATCTNLDGSHACICNDGWKGDGTNCSDADECTLAIDMCHEDAICDNTIGSYQCSCNTGFNGNGFQCTDIDECTLETDNCHDTLATCENTDGSFE